MESGHETDWIKHCTVIEIEEMKQRQCPRMTW